MRVIAYLTEPASYTIDLVRSVHEKRSIFYRFLFKNSFTKGSKDSTPHFLFLDDYNLITRFRILKSDYLLHDAIIFNGYDSISFLFLWIIHITSKIKKPIAIESDTPLKIPNFFLKRIIKKVYLNYLFKNSNLHALVGGTLHQVNLFKYYGMPAKRIHFLPMVIDVKKFNLAVNRNRSKIFTFLFVGRFIPLKQIDVIISEFLLVFENKFEVQLVLIGDGECYKPLHQQYSNYKNIIFKGKLFGQDLINEYEKAHVLVLASNNENWGLVINEAMAAALPVLSNKGIGANHDLIDDKQTGLIFDSKLKGDLAQKMNLIYNDNDLFMNFAENAYNKMHNHWNFNLYDSQLQIAIKKMINDK
ncbi:MAG: glycosyltransferase family 4 protein [Flavobacteriales bacterium]